MKRIGVICILSFMVGLSLSAAHAETIPDYALKKDFENCMGGESEKQSPDRAKYCSCVMDEIRKWDAATYSATAMEQSKTNGTPIDRLAALAKTCIDKVLN